MSRRISAARSTTSRSPRQTASALVFFAAKLEKGVLDTRPEVVLPDTTARAEVLACSYKR